MPVDIQRVCAAVDLDAIRQNADAVLAKIPEGVKLLAVIKANAYGHGAVRIARLLEDRAAYFAVATLDEGIELRENGIETPILVLGGFSECYCEEALTWRLQPAVFSLAWAKAYSRAAEKRGCPAPLHIAADTGMSRIGLPPTVAGAEEVLAISRLPHIRINGVFSHFATADEADLTEALAQRDRFDAFLALLKERDIAVPLAHLNNSAGIMAFDKQYDMVREGIVLYGLYPSEEVDKSRLCIKPALSLFSHISHLQRLPAGRGVSYGHTWVTPRPSTVATIPVGYADGYPRSLSNRGRVLIRGAFCPIVGRICMDQLMVDVTNLPDVSLGDRVTLIGSDGDARISVEEVAALAGSFNYELVCGISARVPRIYTGGDSK